MRSFNDGDGCQRATGTPSSLSFACLTAAWRSDWQEFAISYPLHAAAMLGLASTSRPSFPCSFDVDSIHFSLEGPHSVIRRFCYSMSILTGYGQARRITSLSLSRVYSASNPCQPLLLLKCFGYFKHQRGFSKPVKFRGSNHNWKNLVYGWLTLHRHAATPVSHNRGRWR
ncbi:hypothetical protein BKA64DRAFT_442269 [Cadophora sp. MPI-SDFR-AT-0126]|nr:hypothetical protein BKA64DRAFT_442269 [Leotiomycetes sp. MPI-SDFR-AT-0126]